MTCFIIESRKSILDYLVRMHDQFMLELCRTSRNTHEKKYRYFRGRHKKAVDTVLIMAEIILDMLKDEEISAQKVFSIISEQNIQKSIEDLHIYKRMEERGFCDTLLAKYPNFRKYFSNFVKLPFQVQNGSEYLLNSIEIIRKLDLGILKKHTSPAHIVVQRLTSSSPTAGRSI